MASRHAHAVGCESCGIVGCVNHVCTCSPAPPVGSEGPPVRAAEVLAMDYVLDHSIEPDLDPEDYDALNRNEADRLIVALLAHGSEHGVAILADGSLRPLTEGEASDA